MARKPFWSRVAGHPGVVLGGVISVAFIVFALVGPLLIPHDPFTPSLGNRVVQPVWSGGTWTHPLGTDHLGRDYLARLAWGGRVSLGIGVGVAITAGLIGATLGLLAGFFGGRVDLIIGFVIAWRLSTPVILVALAVVALVGASVQMVVIVLGCLLWDRFAIVVRATTQQLRATEFVAAAEVLGASRLRILAREVLPNLMNALVVVATLEIAQAMLLEAALSFLGLGVQAPLPSWGLMISEAKDLMLFEPWLIAIPGACLFALVLAINLLGDGLRDVTAPPGR